MPASKPAEAPPTAGAAAPAAAGAPPPASPAAASGGTVASAPSKPIPPPPPAASAAPAAEKPPAVAPKGGEFVVYFTQSSSEIPIYALEVLTEAVALLKEFDRSEARIEGHSDALGSPSGNLYVSEARANSVRNHLVKNGIAAERLSTAFFGSDKPADTNNTAEGRSKNRRVVIRITPPPQG
jgi:outer membrane protein OmpA-like peptidoglycan-associated protein